jgi:hypothetical protein
VSSIVKRQPCHEIAKVLFARAGSCKLGTYLAPDSSQARSPVRRNYGKGNGCTSGGGTPKAQRAVANRYVTIAFWIGVLCAIFSGAFTFLSYRSEEPAPRSIVVVLLLFYGILHFAVV